MRKAKDKGVTIKTVSFADGNQVNPALATGEIEVAVQDFEQLADAANARAWLYTIARRACQRMHRKRAGEPARLGVERGMDLEAGATARAGHAAGRQGRVGVGSVDHARHLADQRPQRLAHLGIQAVGADHRAVLVDDGEVVGDGSNPQVDIAVDPLEGTNLCANGLPGALAVLLITFFALEWFYPVVFELSRGGATGCCVVVCAASKPARKPDSQLRCSGLERATRRFSVSGYSGNHCWSMNNSLQFSRN